MFLIIVIKILQLKNKDSVLLLFLLVSIIYSHCQDDINLFYNLFQIEKSFSKAHLIQYVQEFTNAQIGQNEIQNIELLLKLDLKDQQMIKNIFTYKKISLLFYTLLNSYQVQDDKKCGIIYQILKNINQSNLIEGGEAQGLQFLFNPSITEQIFNVILLKDQTQLKKVDFLNLFTTTILSALESKTFEEKQNILGLLRTIDQNNFYQFDMLINIFKKGKDNKIFQLIWEIIINHSIQNTEMLYAQCQTLYNKDPLLYQGCFSSQKYFGINDLTFEFFQEKKMEQENNLLNKNQINEKIMQKIQNTLQDIQDQIWIEEEEILNELVPNFKLLDSENQYNVRTMLSEQFKNYSFVKNEIFQIAANQVQDQNNKFMFQKLKNEKNWKQLIIQFQNVEFCQENQIPLFWKQPQCLKALSKEKHEAILQLVLNLNELCQFNQTYHYLKVIEILVVVLNFSRRSEDRTLIEQIVGSSLNVQMFHFIEYQSNLKRINETEFQKMIQQIQLYQLQGIDEINIQEYDSRFQIYIRVLIEIWNQNNIEQLLNEILQQQNLFEVTSEQAVIQKIQDSFLQGFNIEECYYKLIFYFYIQYCDFSQELTTINTNLKKQKENQERQNNYISRINEKYEKQGDLIQLFLLNTIVCLQEQTYITSQENYRIFLQKQIDLEAELQQYYNKSIIEIIQRWGKSNDLFNYAGYISLIKIQHFFQDKSLGNTLLLLHRLQNKKKLLKELENLNYEIKQIAMIQILKVVEKIAKQTKYTASTVYVFLLFNQIYQFNDREQFYDLISLFRLENSLSKSELLIQLTQIGNKQQISTEVNFEYLIQQLSQQSEKFWFTIKFVIGQQQILNIYQVFLTTYLKNQRTKTIQDYLHSTLINLSYLIQKSSGPSIWSSKQLLRIISKKALDFLMCRLSENKISSQHVLEKTICIIFYVLRKVGEANQIQMVDFFYETFKTSSLKFNIMKNQLQNKLEFQYTYKYLLLTFYNEEKKQDKLLQEAQKLYKSNFQIYIDLFKDLQYFNNFKLTPEFLKYEQIQGKYPCGSEISLEDFNISLQEITLNDKQKIISEWFSNMRDQTKFKQLIPIYFNLIKRKESQQDLLSLINNLKGKDSEGINMKVLFQILFNNSTSELKSILLKLWSSNNPVPLIYFNPEIKVIRNQQDLYILNEKISFIFPECFPIINFSWSKKQLQYGKTQLINKTFYQHNVFEVSDNCQLNENTVDIMFDFCFNGSRQLAIADVHGIIPDHVLIKILPLFKLWIVQMDSEDELEENYQQFKSIQQKIPIPKCCFIIRNSKSEIDSNIVQLEQLITNEQIVIHKVIDFTKKGLNQQNKNLAYEQFSKFIFSRINECLKNQNSKLTNSQDFIEQTFSIYYGKDTPFIEQINSYNFILSELNQELNKQIQDSLGFYSLQAFPIRALQRQIKCIQSEKFEFDGKNAIEREKLIEERRTQINQLKNQIVLQQPTNLLNLFQKIFQQQDYYILYLQFTDSIRSFNELHTLDLKQKNQIINEQIQKINQREKQQNMDQNQNFQQETENLQQVQNIQPLQIEFEKNKTKIELMNIGIELFWRELVQIKQKGKRELLQINPSKIVANLIKKGENFEFLDGDQLQIDQQFLKEVLNNIADSDQEKVLVLSVLGPQSSGKSTILNKIFGCHFWTSVGRCTKGIYLQLLKITQKQNFDNQFDYVLILDTEGLQGPNQTDAEFDKKIALFILAISDIILINVKGDIHSQFKNLVEMCIYTLALMKNSISSVKQLSWCFNQNNDCTKLTPFIEQIDSIVSNLNKQVRQYGDHQEFDFYQFLDIKENNMKILGFASSELTWRINDNTGVFKEWRQQKIEKTFAEEAYIFGIQMIKFFVEKIQKENHSLLSLSQFIQNVQSTWQIVCRFPDLLEFTDFQQYTQDLEMKAAFMKEYQKQKFDYQSRIPQQVKQKVFAQNYRTLDFFKDIENELTMMIHQEVIKIKTEVKNELYKFQKQHQTKNKIYTKYLKQLDESLHIYECNCYLILFEEIKKEERQFQKQKGFIQLDDQVQKISQNSNKMEKLKGQKHLIEEEFQEPWNAILEQSKEQQNNLFQEFSKAQYRAIYSSFSQYQCNSDHQEQFQTFFLELSKQHPIKENSLQEKANILQMYFKEIKSQRQFCLIQNKISKLKYNDIFFQRMEEKIQNREQDFIIELKDLFQYQYQVYIIQVLDFIQYFSGSDFLNDFKTFLKTENNENESFNNKQFFQFFTIIQLCKFQFAEEKYQKLKQYIFNNKGQHLCDSKTKQLFDEFQKGIIRNDKDPLPQIVFEEDISLQIKQLYPSLKLVESFIDGLNQNELRNYCVQQKIDYLFIQKTTFKSKFSEATLVLDYVADQKSNSNNLSQFQNQIEVLIANVMEKNQLWEKIYFQIYDIIKQKMTTARKNFKSDSENEEIISSNAYLIKEIMSEIEQKIQSYNKQFAKFGVILNYSGERCIYYYSIFIIWRFSCFNKWKQLEENHKQLEQMKDSQLQKFIADIEQNKTAQSTQNAKALAKSIKLAIIEKFNENQLPIVCSSFETINMDSAQFVKYLDTKLLSHQENLHQIKDRDRLDYIMNQKQYIERHAVELINQKGEEIQKQQEKKFRTELKQSFDLILNNIEKIYDTTTHYKSLLKSDDFYDEEMRDSDCKLFYIVQKCILGEKIIDEDLSSIIKDFKAIFQQKFERTNIQKVNEKFENPTQMKIPLLKQYIDTLFQEIKQEIKNSVKESYQLQWGRKEIQETQDKLKVNMKGCQFSCPMCKRKCDQANDQNHKHQCLNGHFYRGMNGVLFRNKPSLQICEEINNDALITTLDTSIYIKWIDIKKRYQDWNFNCLNDEEIIIVKEMMKKIWNSGIGNLICQELSLKLNKKIIFQSSTGINVFRQYRYNLKSIHFILMLDDSFSMQGESWEKAKNGALQCMEQIQKQEEGKVSVIVFNTTARVVIDCQTADVEHQKDLLTFQGGLTSFNNAFHQAYNQIIKHFDKQFSQNIILFFTDGYDEYPKEAVELFCSLTLEQKHSIQLISSVQGNSAENSTIWLITNKFLEEQIFALLEPIVQVDDLIQIWSEVVIQSYHDLKS